MKKIFLTITIMLVSVLTLQAQVVTKTISGGSTTDDILIKRYENYNYSQFIYLGSEIGQSGKIKSLTFKLSTIEAGSENKWENWKVSLKETTKTEYEEIDRGQWLPKAHRPLAVSGSDKVFEGNVTYDSSAKTIKVTLSAPFFTYDKNKNLLVEIYEKSPSYPSAVKFYTKGGLSKKRALFAGTSSAQSYDSTSNFSLSSGLKAVPAVDFEIDTTPAGGGGAITELEYCEGEKIELTSAGSTTGGAYKWTKGASTTELADTKDFTVADNAATSDAGTYKLQITKNGCTSDVAEIKVVVNSKPKGITLANNATSNTICTGQSITFTASATSGGAEYEFFVNNVSKQAKSTTNTFVTTALSNNDKVKVKVYTAKGCSDESTETTITVNPEPTTPSIAAANANICASEDAVFNINGGDSEAVVTYKIGTGSEQTVTLTTSGTGTITVAKANLISPTTTVTITKVATKAGCEKAVTASASVTVKPLPQVTDLTVDNASVCAPDAGQDVTFTITGTVGAKVSYTLNGTAGTKIIGSGGTVNVPVTKAKVNQTIILASVEKGSCAGTIASGKKTKTATVTIKPKAIIKKK